MPIHSHSMAIRVGLALLICLVPATCAPPAFASPELDPDHSPASSGASLVARGPEPPEESSVDVPVGTWPLQPEPHVERYFDPPDAPWGAGHRGVDLLALPGQAVRAALPGRVRFVGRIAGRGVVVVDHGATRTTYEPVIGSLKVGTHVAAGAVIGRLEVAGSHCLPGACLHWGWIRNSDDVYLDPLLLVGIRPVRLYPWAGGG